LFEGPRQASSKDVEMAAVKSLSFLIGINSAKVKLFHRLMQLPTEQSSLSEIYALEDERYR
jgi:hypothetical protein